MKITLYNNYGENNNINKHLVKIIDLEGYLREQTSLVNPQIMIELHPDQYGFIKDDTGTYVTFNDNIKITWDSFIYQNVLSANYVYIPDFNRYYFINDITSVRQNLWRLSLHVDVLMSYKKEILNTKAFISRNEFIYNDKLVDELRDYEYIKDIKYHDIENIDDVDEFSSFGTFLVSVTCDDAIYQERTPLPFDNDLGDSLHIRIGENIQGIDRNVIFYVGTYINALFKAIYQDQNLRSYVKYLKAFPFTIPQKLYSDDQIDPEPYVEGLWTHNYHIGSRKDIFSTDRLHMPENNVILKKLGDFIIDNFIDYTDTYLNADPYKVVELWIPFYNFIKIPYHQVHNHNLQLYYLTTIGDGNTTGVLYDKTDDKILWSSRVEISIDIPFSTTNLYENEKRKDGVILSTAIGTLSSVVSTALGVISHNPVMTAGGVMGGVGTITKAITSASQIFDNANVGSGSVTSGIYNSFKPYLKITDQVRINVDEEYNKLYGKPLKQVYKIGDLSGMTIVDDEHLENFGSCLKQENDEIKTLLKGGVIL